jgi:two-component system LytT family response regulator
MKILIVEDEAAAARRLAKMVSELLPEALIVDQLESVTATVAWFKTHGQPDLMLMDIHLADGSCFEVFKQAEITCPVIFITAYDQYAIQAFKVNSIDYLLKPVKKEELEFSFEKLKKIQPTAAVPDFKSMIEQLLEKPKAYQQRFAVKFGQYIKSVEIKQIAMFYAEDKIVFLITVDGQRYPIDISLDKISDQLDPADFFRINRSAVISFHAIKQMFTHFKGRIKIETKTAFDKDLLVSADRLAQFKVWINR